MTPARSLDDVLEHLRAGGKRITSPRRAILEALLKHAGRHPTAEQITADVHDRQPDVDKSTVYRLLDDLEKMGLIDHVHLAHGPAVYHFADDAHHHLVYENCSKVFEVPTGTFDALRRRLLANFDFEMQARHFAIPGRCGPCARASTSQEL